MVNLEALHVMVQNLQSMVTEIKDDGKKTLAQAQVTNGRVNRHDDEFVHLHQALLLMAKKDEEFDNELEVERAWRQRLVGGIVVMNVFMLPPMLYVIYKLIDRIL